MYSNIKLPLRVVDLPAIPVITNVSASSNSITITWNQDSSSDVFSYELRYNFTIRGCENYTGEGSKVINGSLRSYTLRNSSETLVEEDSVYNILLIAMNSDGNSEANISDITTQGASKLISPLFDNINMSFNFFINSYYIVPTGVPNNLGESLINDRMIAIQWEPVECSQRNGAIQGYSVLYYPLNDNNNMVNPTVANVSGSKYTAKGLVFDTQYAFEVRAIGGYGPGPPATSTAQTSNLIGGKNLLFLVAKNQFNFFQEL